MRRVTGRSLMISLGTIACAAAAVISLWPRGLDVRTEDQNGDGRPDVWRVYNRRGQIATVAVDTNFDGRSDVQEYYEGGALVRRESDRDFNDQVDLVQEFDAETRESVRSVTDVDFDGSADLLVLFDGGRPVYSKWRPGFTRADSGGSGVRSSEIPQRTADDRLGAFQDPFIGDLVIRAVRISLSPGDYVGTAQSGGLPRTGEDVVSPLAAAPRLSGSEVSLASSAAVIPHSPRGPPARLLSQLLQLIVVSRRTASEIAMRQLSRDVLTISLPVEASMNPGTRKHFPVERTAQRLTRSAASFVVVCLFLSGCTSPTAEPKPEQKPSPPEEGVVRIQNASRPFIEVNEVSAAKSGSTITAPARVDFRDGAVSQVGAPLEGRIIAVHVLVGQKVSAGDSLVTLDCPEAATMRASAAVAQASLREARIELERQRRMQQEGVGIERNVVATETKVSAAEAELSRVEAGAVSIGSGTASAVVVRAPIGGIVIVRKASIGMAVQRGGDPLVEIGDSSALWIVADVFERDLSHIHPGATTRMTFPSVNRDIEGRVTSIGTVVASGLRTAPVFLTVDTHGVALRPGMYGRVEIDSADAGLTVPVNAVLIKDGKDPVVYVQKDDLTFIRRRVVVAQPVEGRVQIVSGLSPGEQVVVRGALLLDGAADQLL